MSEARAGEADGEKEVDAGSRSGLEAPPLSTAEQAVGGGEKATAKKIVDAGSRDEIEGQPLKRAASDEVVAL